MKANSPGVMADSNGNKILMDVIKKDALEYGVESYKYY